MNDKCRTLPFAANITKQAFDEKQSSSFEVMFQIDCP